MLTYSTRARGGVVHALKLAERLRRKGIGVTLYSLCRDDDAERMDGYFRPIDVPFQIFTYSWDADVMVRLERMIAAYEQGLPDDADIYHAQDCVGGTALARMKQSGAISAPVFRTIHHVDDFAEPRLFEFEKKAVALSDRRFVVSEFWKEALARDFGLESTVTYNGLDTNEFSTLPPRSSDAPMVLFVGGLEPRKGLEFLVLAMSAVRKAHPSARLVAVAKKGFRGVEDPRWFETLAERAGVSDACRFIESVDQAELMQLYADCDIVALPSRNEGWGLSLMEAMACARPVIATDVGGIPELVRDGSEGILIEPGDVAGLGREINGLLSDDVKRRRMGLAGKERVRAFSWDETAERVIQQYEAVLQQCSPNSRMK